MKYKLVLAVLTAIFAVWIFADQMPSVFARRNECPHPAFLRKHFCPNCDEDEAMQLSRGRQRGNRRIPKNTVLTGSTTFTRRNNGMCVNEDPVPVYNCNVNQNRCRKQGDRCIASHHTETGHLYYRDIECNWSRAFLFPNDYSTRLIFVSSKYFCKFFTLIYLSCSCFLVDKINSQFKNSSLLSGNYYIFTLHIY